MRRQEQKSRQQDATLMSLVGLLIVSRLIHSLLTFPEVLGIGVDRSRRGTYRACGSPLNPAYSTQ